MTGPFPQASPEWTSTTRWRAEHEHPRWRAEHEQPRRVDAQIINGAAKAGPTRPAGQLDPIHILGCSREEAVELFHGRPVTPGEAEAIAERSYPWRRHLHDPNSYWITTAEAARILDLTPRHVRRLLDRGQLQYVRHASGVRLMRRAHIVALGETRY
jgi:excisionase family DNA binding protein